MTRRRDAREARQAAQNAAREEGVGEPTVETPAEPTSTVPTEDAAPEMAAAPAIAAGETVGAPTREQAAAAAAGAAPEVVVSPEPERGGAAPRVEPRFEATAAEEAPPITPPEGTAAPRPGASRDRKESRAAALAASSAALAPPAASRRRWATVRRALGFGLAALFLGWVAGLASATSVFGPIGEDGSATGRSAASAAPVATSTAVAAPPALSAKQFAALQDELHGLRQQIRDLRNEVRHTRREADAKATAPSAPASASAAAGGAAKTSSGPSTKVATITDAVPPTLAGSEQPGPSDRPHSTADETPASQPIPAAPAAGKKPGQPAIAASVPAPAAAPALPQPAPPGLKQAALAHENQPALRASDSAGNGDAPGRVLDRFSLRGVARGRALVESRDGALREVMVGDYLPGAGRIGAIVRRHGEWVVVAERGLIVSGLY